MFRTHRQRVPAMLAVACAGMLVVAVAGAAPDDGRELAPVTCSSTAAGPSAPGCFQTAADKDSTPTTEKGDKGSTADKCEPTTDTTEKGDGKGSTTSTTRKGDDKDPTTTTTDKDGKDGTDGKDSTPPTTDKDADKESTTTTAKDDAKDDSTASKAAAPSTALDAKGTTATTAKDSDSKSGSDSGKDDGCKSTTTTTEKDGKGDGGSDGKATTTTRKSGGKGSTTTTTEKDAKGDDKSGDKGSTTSTTRQNGTVEPRTPSDPDSGGSSGPDTADPGDTPISPQEAPPYDATDSDPGPADAPEAAADPGPVDSFDTWDDEDEVAINPLEAPGSGAMMPVLDEFIASPAEKASTRRTRSRETRSSGRGVQQLAASPVVTLRPSAQSVAESAAVSRRLGGMQSSATTESAFPASIISTPGRFPVNHRDPLAAAALVVLVGVSRELFKVWRRRATDFWPA